MHQQIRAGLAIAFIPETAEYSLIRVDYLGDVLQMAQ
jgi:hypothetical protein